MKRLSCFLLCIFCFTIIYPLGAVAELQIVEALGDEFNGDTLTDWIWTDKNKINYTLGDGHLILFPVKH